MKHKKLIKDGNWYYASEVRFISGCALILLAAYEIATADKFSLEKVKMKRFGFFKTMFFVSFLGTLQI